MRKKVRNIRKLICRVAGHVFKRVQGQTWNEDHDICFDRWICLRCGRFFLFPDFARSPGLAKRFKAVYGPVAKNLYNDGTCCLREMLKSLGIKPLDFGGKLFP